VTGVQTCALPICTLDADALLTPTGRRQQHDALLALLDRLAARLGPQHVRQARIVADHRLECAQVWQPAVAALAGTPAGSPQLSGPSRPARQPGPPPSPPSARSMAKPPGLNSQVDPLLPHPTWLLDQPLPLALSRDGLRERPVYQGPLTLLAGPHRIEAGWWEGQASQPLVTRDYYLASSAQAGLLWIFRTRHAPDDRRSPWFLHGFFA